MTFPDYKAKSLTFKNTMVYFLRKRPYLFTQAQRCTADSTPHPPAIEGWRFLLLMQLALMILFLNINTDCSTQGCNVIKPTWYGYAPELS